MACCFDGIGEYAVTPILISPRGPESCCFETTTYCPYLPRCPKKQAECCEIKPQSKYPKMSTSRHNCCSEYSERPRSPTYRKCQTAHLPQEYCPTCKSSCKPVKTKYIIPCYRYEDGRIVNQPTTLMRRACEVAVGARPRRKPFVVSSFSADPDQEVHRYVSEDERGNCCYHFEKKKHDLHSEDCHSSHSYPQCGDSVRAAPTLSGNCYYYCC